MLTTGALLFALNLFALPMDVQWGGGRYEAQGLFSRGAARGVWVEAGVAGAVQFRRAGQKAWSQAKDAAGPTAETSLEAGAVYVLVVRPNGNGELVRLGVSPSASPQVLFVNAAKGPVASLRLGAVGDGLEPGWGAFLDAPSGRQTLTWSWPTMPPGTEVYRAASTQPGQPGVTTLAEGHWYVAVVSGVNGQVFDITP